jgi:hypothetical protein
MTTKIPQVVLALAARSCVLPIRAGKRVLGMCSPRGLVPAPNPRQGDPAALRTQEGPRGFDLPEPPLAGLHQ